MATGLSFQPLNQNQQILSAHHLQPPYPSGGANWMWTSQPPRPAAITSFDDDSWEVRAFAEDTGSAMGTTWPPRSYTCNFCRREFRSAQALGGHMNIHRRDRARLHQVLPPPSAASSGAVFLPSQEFAAADAAGGGGGGGLCLLYQLPVNHSIPNGVIKPTTVNHNGTPPPPALFSVSPYPAAVDSRVASLSSIGGGQLQPLMSNFPMLPPPPGFGAGTSKLYHRESEVMTSPRDDTYRRISVGGEEVDLELRLGQGPASTSSS